MDKKFKLQHANGNPTGDSPINLRCPACHRLGTLDTLRNAKDMDVTTDGTPPTLKIGFRVCPNPGCRLLIFIGYHAARQDNKPVSVLAVSYPAERLDFDASSLPAPIVNALEEAITCHAQGCFIAGAIMVRKTLEELCHDQKATGKRLVNQIESLKTKVMIPAGLLEGMDNLRLLGNDAAHVVLKDFDQIGSEELEVGILFTKELLKAVYQSSILADRLKALKK